MTYGSIAAAPAAPPSSILLRRLVASFGVIGAWVVVAGAVSSRDRGTVARGAAAAALSVSAPGYAPASHPVSVDQALENCAALPRTPETYRDCPAADVNMWCLRMASAFASGALDPADCDTEMCLSMATSKCARSCANDDGTFAAAGWFEPCAWDAMAHFDDFCDGTWEPALPAAVESVETGDDDAAYAAAKALGADGGNDVADPGALNKCDAKAFCMACGADDAARDSCRAALAPVGGVLAFLPTGDREPWGPAPSQVPDRPADADYVPDRAAPPGLAPGLARRRLGQGGQGGVAVLLNKGDFCGADRRA